MDGQCILYQWPSVGWLIGTIIGKPKSPLVDWDGDPVNWMVKFEGENFLTGCALDMDHYTTRNDAEENSWTVVSEVSDD